MIPTYISKSILAALNCEAHFASLYLTDYQGPAIDNEPRRTGVDFHAFMASYINHLTEADLKSDPPFVDFYLATHCLTADAASLIQSNAATFQIDPDLTLGTEIFLCIDEKGAPVSRSEAQPGYRPPPGSVARFGGTLDWVMIQDDVATVVDWKTTWSMLSVSDAEAAMYALLLFCFFRTVRTVHFSWYFARLGKAKSVTWERKDVDAVLWPMVNRSFEWMQDVARRYEISPDSMSVNPMSGRCPYCVSRCPLFTDVESARLPSKADIMIPPLQGEAAAVAVGQRLLIARLYADRAERALKQYVDANGPLNLGLGFEAGIENTTCRSYPLLPACEALGLKVMRTCPDCKGKGYVLREEAGLTLQEAGFIIMPDEPPCPRCFGTGYADALANEDSPLWDIPLERLTVGGLSGYAKAKKRAPLKEALAEMAVEKQRTTLKIRREEDGLTLLGNDDEG